MAMRQFALAFRVTTPAFRTTEGNERRDGMRIRALVVFSLALLCPAQASSQTSQIARETLEKAILLAGPDAAGLPIVLASVVPDEASRGIEAWMLPGPEGSAARIVVYSGSDVFRCASQPYRLDYQCLLKLASIIIHEAWHCRHGPGEAGAYDEQIAFLRTHGGAGTQISGVRLSRDRVLAAQRAIERRRK